MDVLKQKLLQIAVTNDEKKTVEEASTLEELYLIEKSLRLKYQMANKKIIEMLIVTIKKYDFDDNLRKQTPKQSNDNNQVNYILDDCDCSSVCVNSNYGIPHGSKSSGYKSNGVVLYKW